MSNLDRMFLFRPLKTLDEGCAFIRQLIDNDLMFHFEDDPSDIIKGLVGDLLFTRSEANAVRQRVRELYSLDWKQVGEDCPIGYALAIEDPDWKDRA